MAIEHVDIPDGERHPPKGADLATAGSVMFSDGAGDVTWALIDFADITGSPDFSLKLIKELEDVAITDQIFGAANVAEVITYGGVGVTSPTGSCETNAAGTLTFNKEGSYMVVVELCVSKTTGAGGTDIFFKQELNGTNLNPIKSVRFTGSSSDQAQTVSFTTLIPASIADTYVIKGMKDAGTNNAGLRSATSAIAGWTAGSTPAMLTVYRLGAI